VIVTIISFLVVLMILVMAHEMGHLFAAKKLGVRVETFSIGFGPKIARINKGGTNYVISLIPLGGYVQLGEESATCDFDPHSPHYAQRPPLHKIIIALAGPAANFILAVVVFAIVSVIGITSPSYMGKPADIGWVSPASAAAKAGLRSGDRIIEIAGKEVRTWKEMISSIPLYEKNEIPVKFTRGGTPGWTRVTHVSRLNYGLSPAERITINAIAKNSPAEQAGLFPGDVIIAIGGEQIVSWTQFQHIVSHAKTSLSISFNRKGDTGTTALTPRIDASGKGLAGVSYSPVQATTSFTIASAAVAGFIMTGDTISDSVQTFLALFTGSVSIKALGGPVAIAQASGSTAKAGFAPLLAFLAFMSIQLGVFNLVPFIPIVDGGQVTLFLFELLRRKPFGELSLERFAKAGWAFMGMLFLFVTYNDVLRLL
jgi:regulator of sigma E protease